MSSLVSTISSSLDLVFLPSSYYERYLRGEQLEDLRDSFMEWEITGSQKKVEETGGDGT